MIVTYATKNYVEKLVLLLSSFRYSNPNGHLRVYGLGWSEELLEKARKAYPRFTFIGWNSSEKIDANVAIDKRSGESLRLKPKLLLEIYDQTDKPVVWVDADTLILRPVAPLIERVDKHGDFGVYYRPNASLFAKFAVAVMYFTRTAKGDEILRCYVEEAAVNEGKADWYQDQLGLLEAYKKVKAKLCPLTRQEHSLYGECSAMMVSRRPLFDVAEMYEALRLRNIPVTKIE